MVKVLYSLLTKDGIYWFLDGKSMLWQEGHTGCHFMLFHPQCLPKSCIHMQESGGKTMLTLKETKSTITYKMFYAED